MKTDEQVYKEQRDQLVTAITEARESCYGPSPTKNPTITQLCGWVWLLATDRNCMKSNWEASEKARKQAPAPQPKPVERDIDTFEKHHGMSEYEAFEQYIDEGW